MVNTKKSRAFVFTINNWTPDHITSLDSVECKYVIYGKEIAPTTGTPHLQGYIYYEHPRLPKSVKKDLKCTHVQYAKGTAEQNYVYCSKEHQHTERGVKPMDQSEKGDASLAKWNGILDSARNGRFHEIPADLYIRHYSTIKKIRMTEAPVVIPSRIISDLRPWQQDLLDHLLTEPDSRKVIWFSDTLGGMGKSAMATYLHFYHDAFVTDNGSSKDIAYSMPDSPRIVIVDLTRETEERVNYAIIEAMKNGRVVSHKYESKVRYFEIPHVVVFANFPPRMSALSMDRWDIRYMEQPFIQ